MPPWALRSGVILGLRRRIAIDGIDDRLQLGMSLVQRHISSTPVVVPRNIERPGTKQIHTGPLGNLAIAK
jgi:hypothetical protein